MPQPKPYDKECLDVQAKTGAETVVLVVLGGSEGSGFALNSVRDDARTWLPDVLRQIAHLVEEGQGQ
jgi:hypothetical protein